MGMNRQLAVLSAPARLAFHLCAPIAIAALTACSSSGGGSTADGDPAPVSASSLQGAWRVCDSFAQTTPGNAYFIGYGGSVVELTAQGDTLSADYRLGDGGTSFDGTYHFLSGSFDPTTRLWTPDLYDESAMNAPDGAPLENDYSGDVALTFDSTGNRFNGMGLNDGQQPQWYGGREDGTFTCDQSMSGAASAKCSGNPSDCEGQEPGYCTNGCYLIIGATSEYDSCGGSPTPCAQVTVQDLCAKAGCQWTQ